VQIVAELWDGAVAGALALPLVRRHCAYILGFIVSLWWTTAAVARVANILFSRSAVAKAAAVLVLTFGRTTPVAVAHATTKSVQHLRRTVSDTPLPEFRCLVLLRKKKTHPEAARNEAGPAHRVLVHNGQRADDRAALQQLRVRLRWW
jgi:hypothetical protein